MFKWYGRAKVCYAYLADVNDVNGAGPFTTDNFTSSRWFARGWTLQELLAPTRLEFYDSKWTMFALRTDPGASAAVSAATGIDRAYLNQPSYERLLEKLRDASIAERMCWASRRKTTREEDIAYCLLGIFDISMALVYGEGKRAFRRLQEEIIKYSNDQSLLAWIAPTDDSRGDRDAGMLATSPLDFVACGNLAPCPIRFRHSSFSITNQGMRITLPMFGDYALLECHPKHDPTMLMTLNLRHLHSDTYARAVDLGVAEMDYRAWHEWERKTVNVVTHPESHRETQSKTIDIIVRETPKGYKAAHTRFAFDLSKSENGQSPHVDCDLEREGF